MAEAPLALVCANCDLKFGSLLTPSGVLNEKRERERLVLICAACEARLVYGKTVAPVSSEDWSRLLEERRAR